MKINFLRLNRELTLVVVRILEGNIKEGNDVCYKKERESSFFYLISFYYIPANIIINNNNNVSIATYLTHFLASLIVILCTGVQTSKIESLYIYRKRTRGILIVLFIRKS